MKQVFNTNEVAHVWANQTQQTGRNAQGNFYFEGGTIYSYGWHFPIATIDGNKVVFTLRTYSNTTAKQISKVRGAVSHKDKIYCYEVPTASEIKGNYLTSVHEKNLNSWKANIKSLFAELGNKRLRIPQTRINDINHNIEQLQAYCTHFKTSVKDAELKSLLKLAAMPDFLEQARGAKDKADKANALKMKKAVKAYDNYLNLWRAFDNDAINEMPEQAKELCRFYTINAESLTHLRLNKDENRIETSKGVQIPVEIAKRAYLALNGCFAGKCDGLAIPVMHYTITKTTDKAIIAGCHTIPKEDIKYIANLLQW